MKRTLIILILLIFSESYATGKLKGKIENLGNEDKILLTIPFDCWYYKDTSVEIKPDKNGNFSTTFQIDHAQNIFVHINDQKLLIYAEPGKNNQFTADLMNLRSSINFTGELQNENNFRKDSGLLFSSLDPESLAYQTASLNSILEHIHTSQAKYQDQLKAGNFSDDFIKMTKEDLKYVEHSILWDLIMGKRKALQEDRQAWSLALKDAHSRNQINNEQAINSYFYQIVLAYFPNYLHIGLSKNELAEKVEEIMNKDFKTAIKEIKSKGEQFWEFQVYKTYFEGEVLEKLLASFIENGVRYGKLKYLTETYTFFTNNYPKSQYNSYLENLMEPVLDLENEELTSFELTNPSNDTFSEIISEHTGKVVLVDLWGSWCGPCKSEFKFSPALKKKFENKPVDFVYIAFEHERENPEENWKKTANFYDLQGRHILADENLKKNIEMLYGSPDQKYFPRYILVDKNGEIADLTAPKPSSTDVLYQKINELLN